MAGFLARRTVGFLVSQSGVEEDELAGPRVAASEAGARTLLIAPERGLVTTSRHCAPCSTHDVDQTFAKVDWAEFDALVLPDGRTNSTALRTEPSLVPLLRAFCVTGRPVGAFGHAVWSLLDAGVVGGRNVTSNPALRRDVERAGGRWHDRRVVVDENVITSRGSDDVAAFNTQLIAYLDSCLALRPGPRGPSHGSDGDGASPSDGPLA